MTQTCTATSPAPQSLRCMEIWGGNEAFDSAVSVPGIDVWVHSQPYGGQDRGGDIHYVSSCGHGQIARFVVADVAGHGQAVGELATKLRTMMRKHINKLDQTRFVQILSAEFSSMAREDKFATALLASYFAGTDHLVLCNAGHPRPLWFRAKAGTWAVVQHDIPERIEKLRNLPLGVVADTNYYQFAIQLEKDDLVLMYTDSLTEARDPNGELLGEEGLLNMVQGCDPAHPELLVPGLLTAIDEYRGRTPPDDDLTVMLLRHNAAAPPRQSMLEMARVLGKMVGLVKV